MFDLLKHRTSIFWTGLIVLLLCAFAYSTGIFSSFDNKLTYYFFRFNQTTVHSNVPDIAIIEINKEDLQKNYLWPWGKDWHPYFINLLLSYKPKAIIFFTSDEFIKTERKHKLLEHVDQTKITTIDYDFHSDLITKSGGFHKVNFRYKKNGRVKTSEISNFICSYYSSGKQKYDCLITDKYMTIEKSGTSFFKIPLDKGGLKINFIDSSRFTHYNYYDLLVRVQRLNVYGTDAISPPEFENKIIIFSDKEKVFFTPVGNLSKAEVLANAIYTVINKKFIKSGYIFNLPFIFFSGILLFILLTKFNFVGRTFIWMISMIGLLGMCYYLFTLFGILITSFTPLFLITLMYIDVNIYRYLQYRNMRILLKKCELAREMKRRIIPSRVPRLDGADLQVGMIEFPNVGIDFYNFVKINMDRIIIIVGTLSEDGLEGVQQMEKINTRIQLLCNEDTKLESLFKQLNQDLWIESKQGKFVNLVVCDIEVNDGVVRLLNSGVIPPFIVYPRSYHIRRIKSNDPAPLGIYRNRNFQEQIFRLEKSDIFVILTEGMHELSEKAINGVDFEKIFSKEDRSIGHAIGRLIAESKKIFGRDFNIKDRTIIAIKRV